MLTTFSSSMFATIRRGTNGIFLSHRRVSLIASYFVWANGPVRLDNESAFTSEVQFTLDQIQLAPENESPWNYLRGYVS